MREYGDIVASRRELANVDRRRPWDAIAPGRLGRRTSGQDLAFASRRCFRTRPGVLRLPPVTVLALGIGRETATMFGLNRSIAASRSGRTIADPASWMMIRYLRQRARRDRLAGRALSFPMYLDLRNTRGRRSRTSRCVLAGTARRSGADSRARRASGRGGWTADYFRTAPAFNPGLGRFLRIR